MIHLLLSSFHPIITQLVVLICLSSGFSGGLESDIITGGRHAKIVFLTDQQLETTVKNNVSRK
jgi:hypothetical protein